MCTHTESISLEERVDLYPEEEETEMHHLHVCVDVTTVIHVGGSKWFKASTDATHVDTIGGHGAVKSCCIVPLHGDKHPPFTCQVNVTDDSRQRPSRDILKWVNLGSTRCGAQGYLVSVK